MKTIYLIIFLFCFTTVYSQNYYISGYVQDKLTGEKLLNANVYIENLSIGTVTNNYGYYNISVKKADTINISVSFIGYSTQKELIVVSGNKIVNFYLETNNQLNEVVISATKPIEQRNEMGVAQISMKQIETLPAIGGEPDLMKIYQLMPGVKNGNEGSSGLYVRGGSYDENMVLLDDVPLYYVNHLGGLISVFNTDAINSTTLIKGGFPARYGGRLSSVIDVRMKDGNLNENHGNFSIGVIDTKFSFEGPIIKNKSSFIISIRGIPWEILYRPLTILALDGLSIGYNYYDANMKWNTKINTKNQIFFSFYSGDDNIVSSIKDMFSSKNKNGNNTIRWGNFLTALRWNHIFASNFFCNTTLSYTRYRFLNSFFIDDKDLNNTTSQQFKTSINDLMLKSVFEYNINSSYKLKFGYNSIIHSFNPGMSAFKLNENNETKIDSTYSYKKYKVPENIVFLENEFNLSKFFSANIGIHFSDYYIQKTNFYSIQPRILLNFNFSNYFSIKTSYSEMEQYVHLLSSNTIALPMDIWIPSTKNIKPSDSRQISLGFYKTIKKNLLELSIESYYKTSDNLISYKEGASFKGVVDDWENKIELSGIGKSYGIEIMLQKKQGKTTGWIAYTISKSERTFENINLGKPFPYKYDRRHDVSVVLMHNFNKNIDISATWVYGSGYPYTLAVSQYGIESMSSEFYNNNSVETPEIFIYSNRNQFRMRAYHKLDLGVNFRKQKKNGERTISLSIYNVYNRQNPYYYYTKVVNNEVKLFQKSFFPIIPSISYSFKF